MAYSFGDIAYFENKLLFRLSFFRFICRKALYSRTQPALNYASANHYLASPILHAQQSVGNGISAEFRGGASFELALALVLFCNLWFKMIMTISGFALVVRKVYFV